MASNITEMTNELMEVFNGLRTGTIQPKEAVEINNTAGKIIGAVKVQLAYHQMRDEVPNFAMLNDTTAK